MVHGLAGVDMKVKVAPLEAIPMLKLAVGIRRLPPSSDVDVGASTVMANHQAPS